MFFNLKINYSCTNLNNENIFFKIACLYFFVGLDRLSLIQSRNSTNKENTLIFIYPFFKENIRSVPFLYSTASVIFDDEYKKKNELMLWL